MKGFFPMILMILVFIWDQANFLLRQGNMSTVAKLGNA